MSFQTTAFPIIFLYQLPSFSKREYHCMNSMILLFLFYIDPFLRKFRSSVPIYISLDDHEGRSPLINCSSKILQQDPFYPIIAEAKYSTTMPRVQTRLPICRSPVLCYLWNILKFEECSVTANFWQDNDKDSEELCPLFNPHLFFFSLPHLFCFLKGLFFNLNI